MLFVYKTSKLHRNADHRTKALFVRHSSQHESSDMSEIRLYEPYIYACRWNSKRIICMIALVQTFRSAFSLLFYSAISTAPQFIFPCCGECLTKRFSVQRNMFLLFSVQRGTSNFPSYALNTSFGQSAILNSSFRTFQRKLPCQSVEANCPKRFNRPKISHQFRKLHRWAVLEIQQEMNIFYDINIYIM